HAKDKLSFTMPEFHVGPGVTVSITSSMDQLDLVKLKGLFEIIAKEKRIVFGVLPPERLLYIVENAESPNIKGQALEELAAQLFATVDGFFVNERVRTATEEIDITITNNSDDPRLKREGALIIAECKNWSGKCGKNEFVILREKVENRNKRCTIGY